MTIVTMRDIKHLVVALRTELMLIGKVKSVQIKVMLEEEGGSITQIHLSGRPPYDVTRVARNNQEIAVYRNTPNLNVADFLHQSDS